MTAMAGSGTAVSYTVIPLPAFCLRIQFSDSSCSLSAACCAAVGLLDILAEKAHIPETASGAVKHISAFFLLK